MNISIDAYDVSVNCPYVHKPGLGCTAPDYDFPCHTWGGPNVQNMIEHLLEKVDELEKRLDQLDGSNGP